MPSPRDESPRRGTSKFKKGDLVKLKSGGPAMTVVGILRIGDPDSATWLAKGWKDGDVLCSWAAKTHAFEPDWLEPVRK